MFTQCPECKTVFEIGPADLAVAAGAVRCGECSQTFNALKSLGETPLDFETFADADDTSGTTTASPVTAPKQGSADTAQAETRKDSGSPGQTDAGKAETATDEAPPDTPPEVADDNLIDLGVTMVLPDDAPDLSTVDDATGAPDRDEPTTEIAAPGDTASDDSASDDSASDDSASDDTTSDDTTSDDTTSDDTTSDDTTSDDTTSDDTTSDDTASDDSASDDTTSDDTASDDTTSDDTTSDDTTSDDTASDDTTSDDTTSDDTASDDTTSDDTTSDDTTSDDTTSDDTASDDSASDDSASDDTASDDTASDDTASDDTVSEPVADADEPEELAAAAEASDDEAAEVLAGDIDLDSAGESDTPADAAAGELNEDGVEAPADDSDETSENDAPGGAADESPADDEVHASGDDTDEINDTDEALTDDGVYASDDNLDDTGETGEYRIAGLIDFGLTDDGDDFEDATDEDVEEIVLDDAYQPPPGTDDDEDFFDEWDEEEPEWQASAADQEEQQPESEADAPAHLTEDQAADEPAIGEQQDEPDDAAASTQDADTAGPGSESAATPETADENALFSLPLPMLYAAGTPTIGVPPEKLEGGEAAIDPFAHDTTAPEPAITSADILTAPAPADAALRDNDAIDAEDARDLSDYLRAPRPGPLATAGWIGGSVLLALLLLGQFVHQYRGDLVMHPRFGSVVSSLYESAGIDVRPNWRINDYKIVGQARMIEMQAGETATGDDAPDSLRFVAIIANRADRPQPPPMVRVTLRDRWGDPTGVRDFTPPEYLSDRAMVEELLEPGQRLRVVLNLQHPGVAIEGFDFNMCLRDVSGTLRCASEPSS